MDHTTYNAKLFGRWAPIYDGFELFLAGVRREIVRTFDPADKTILDVATGTGSLAIALSETARAVTGIDLSEKMLDVARGKRAEDNLTFLQMDAGDLAFQDDAFDVVTVSLGLHDMPPDIRTATVREAKRVLRPDGRLYVLEYDLPQDTASGRWTARAFDLFESRYFRGFLKTDLTTYLSGLGFERMAKTSHLFGRLQLLTLRHA